MSKLLLKCWQTTLKTFCQSFGRSLKQSISTPALGRIINAVCSSAEVWTSSHIWWSVVSPGKQLPLPSCTQQLMEEGVWIQLYPLVQHNCVLPLSQSSLCQTLIFVFKQLDPSSTEATVFLNRCCPFGGFHQL